MYNILYMVVVFAILLLPHTALCRCLVGSLMLPTFACALGPRGPGPRGPALVGPRGPSWARPKGEDCKLHITQTKARTHTD